MDIHIREKRLLTKEEVKSLKEKMGKKVLSYIEGKPTTGLFCGFWNNECGNLNSQTTQSEIPIPYPFHILTTHCGMLTTNNLTFF